MVLAEHRRLPIDRGTTGTRSPTPTSRYVLLRIKKSLGFRSWYQMAQVIGMPSVHQIYAAKRGGDTRNQNLSGKYMSRLTHLLLLQAEDRFRIDSAEGPLLAQVYVTEEGKQVRWLPFQSALYWDHLELEARDYLEAIEASLPTPIRKEA